MNTITREKFRNYFFRQAVRQNQNRLSDLKMANAIKNNSIGDLDNTVLNKITSNIHDAIMVEASPPTAPGRTIEVFYVNPPFERITDRSNLEAQKASGGYSNFNSRTSDSNPLTGEMNISVVSGEWFDTIYDYPNTSPINYNTTCSALAKAFLVGPYAQDVEIRAVTSAHILPENEEMLLYIDRGNKNIEFAGVNLVLSTQVGYYGADGKVHGSGISNFEMINVRRSVDMAENTNKIERNVTDHRCTCILPAGASQIGYMSYISGIAYSSKNNNPDPDDTGDFGIALLDLRNKVSGRPYPIIRDPFTRWDKPPYGGVKISVTIEVLTPQ